MDRVPLGAMVAKIVGFGDSFIFGSEVEGNHDGSLGWPGVAARKLGCDYHTTAVPGCGNEHIAQQIYQYFAQHDPTNTLAVINWTWTMRWDFYLDRKKTWISLGPTCVPEKLHSILDESEAQTLIDFYQRYTGSSHVWNMSRSLQAMFSVQSFLRDLGVPSVQTFMDRSLWQENLNSDILGHYRAFKAAHWPDLDNAQDIDFLPDAIAKEVYQSWNNNQVPAHIQILQKHLIPIMEDFRGMTFLEWCEEQGFEISPRLHPLGDAHNKAAEIWIERYRCLI